MARRMGITRATTILAGRKARVRVSAIVNTGANVSSIPRRLADKIRAYNVYERQVKYGNGRVFKESIGSLRVSILGSRFIETEAIISESQKDVIIGVTEIERLGFAIDPRNRRLVELPAQIMY